MRTVPFLLVAAFTAPSGAALGDDPAKGGWRKMPGAAPCFCTDTRGKRHALGSEICLSVGGRSFRARCVMAQNVPFWRDKREGCLTGSLPPATAIPRAFAALR